MGERALPGPSPWRPWIMGLLGGAATWFGTFLVAGLLRG